MNLLHVKRLGIDTFLENVAYISHECQLSRSHIFGTMTKIQIHHGNKSLLATLHRTNSDLLKTNEIGLSEKAFERLGAHEGASVSLSHPNPLTSTEFIRQKLEGCVFDKNQLKEIISDILAYRYSNIELTAFVVACSLEKMSEAEIGDLTEVMIESGESINWNLPLVMDKHCIGGIPGNRTTMIVVPIISSFGLPIPKTSSRAITSPSGTADTMEVLAQVSLSLEQMKKMLEQEKACIAWGGSLRLSPVDDIIISVERPLNLDSQGQMIASILSKKKSAGSTHVLLDIPVGETAKIKNKMHAQKLAGLFESIGKRVGLKVRTLITDGSQPIGFGIGPALEAQDVLDVLQNRPDAPQDLREKSLFLSGEILEFSGQVPPGQGLNIARDILDSGRAYLKFKNIVDRQGAQFPSAKAACSRTIFSQASGSITSLHNRKISRVAKLAGAPFDKQAGIKLHVKKEAKVDIHSPLLTVYAETEEQLHFALDYIDENPDIVTMA